MRHFITQSIFHLILLLFSMLPFADSNAQAAKKKSKKVAAAEADDRAPAPQPTARSVGFTDPTTGMKFVNLSGGCFQMGDNFGDGDGDEKPVHEVCVSDFAIGKYEVTQGEYKRIIGSNPSHFSLCGDNCPVEKVSCNDVQDFINKLNSQSGRNYRLPTEAEWEYAARSGGKREKYSGGDNVNAVSWYGSNSGAETHPVGQKQANGLGIYDMSGNVWEWAKDWKGDYSSGSQQNPQGPSSGSNRVIRGGSWYNVARHMRAAYRYNFSPDDRRNHLGFRLASPVQPDLKPSEVQTTPVAITPKRVAEEAPVQAESLFASRMAKLESARDVSRSSTVPDLTPKVQSPLQSTTVTQHPPGASGLTKLEERYRREFEKDIAEGDTRFLNSDDFLFGSFLRRFESAVYGVWRYPREAALRGIEGITPVRMTFNKRGEITNIKQLESSGARILDEEVFRTLRAIGPVGGFPKGYDKEEFHLIVFFQYGGSRRALR